MTQTTPPHTPTSAPLPTHIDLLRHGQVQTQGLFCAPTAEPLSQTGWEQLQHATALIQPDKIISSPSQRCYAFAQTLSARLSCPLQAAPSFQEMNFGRWVGVPAHQLWEEDTQRLQLLWNQPLDFIAPEGESMLAFIQRVQQGWSELLTQHQGQHLLLITHAGVIRVLLAQALGIPYQNTLRFELGHAQGVRIRVYADGTPSVYGLGVEQFPC